VESREAPTGRTASVWVPAGSERYLEAVLNATADTVLAPST
jgi:hypothetical protein